MFINFFYIIKMVETYFIQLLKYFLCVITFISRWIHRLLKGGERERGAWGGGNVPKKNENGEKTRDEVIDRKNKKIFFLIIKTNVWRHIGGDGELNVTWRKNWNFLVFVGKNSHEKEGDAAAVNENF